MTEPNKLVDAVSMESALNEADMMSQCACSSIQMIARLALLAMESSSVNMETIAEAIIEIQNMASTLENDINVIAERFGCNFVDELARSNSAKRHEAYSAKARSPAAAGACNVG